MLTVGSLFSGIGGIDLSCEWAGMQIIWQCEIDNFCRKVLTKHWPEVPKYGDIRQLHNPPRPDVIVGGFPCQPFSVAGKQRGEEDDRYLWPEMLRIIQETKPRWVVGENVAGLVNMVEFEYTLTSLENEGYEVQPLIIPACGVGANHRRERVFIVGYSEHNGLSSSEVRRSIDKTSHNDTKRQNQTGEFEGADRPGCCEDVAYTDSSRCIHRQSQEQPTETRQYAQRESISSGANLADTNKQGLQRNQEHGSNGGKWQEPNDKQFVRCYRTAKHWEVEPSVGRVANGIPHRVDRLKTLGNAVVPQQIYPILQAIADIEVGG
jgi:DNA (cytosine-5)-methyltransferase 1